MGIKLLAESLPRLMWQTSLFMTQAGAAGQVDPTVLVSLLCTAAVGLKTSVEYGQMLLMVEESTLSDYFGLLLGPGLCALLVARALMAAFICPTHEYGLTTGCV